MTMIRSLVSTLNELRDHVHAVSTKLGFKEKEVPVGDMIANLHGEVSELWEAYREGRLDKPCDKAEKMAAMQLRPLTCAEEELADILIRCLDTAKDLNIDIADAVAIKDSYNQNRPYRNGSDKHGPKLALSRS
jgi:NTP pyrophosphatase (non-canonical NTP hydrolase)